MKIGRQVTKVDAVRFWKEHTALAKDCGCYLFAFRAARGCKPVYAGKASHTFKQEVFTSHKLNKFNEGLANQKKGTPVLFFVCLSRTRGAVNKVAIDEAESYLIQAGMAANPSLLNDKKTKVAGWSINGVVRSRRGKPSAAAKELCDCIRV